MNPNVDLRQLAVRREPSANGTPGRRRPGGRYLVSRYLLPAAVLLGFAGLMGWSSRGSLFPARSVTVVPVLTTRAEVRQAGTPVFQAAGWVEPRPAPLLVTAMAEGVVEQMLVVEGQTVNAGEPVARLVEADARLALTATEADLRLREAELAGARVGQAAAQKRATQPVHLEAALAEAEALFARAETERAAVPFQLQAAEARLLLARQNLDGKKAVTGAVPAQVLNQAQSEVATTSATVEELKGRQARLDKEIHALARRRDALQMQLDQKTEEIRQLGETEQNIKAAEARRDQAKNAVDTARLRLERMTVRAPQQGQVLNLVARTGMRVTGLAPASLHDSSTVITLYDPTSLQVRADVPLDQVPRVQPGQPVKIETDAVPGGPLDGAVLFKTSQADVQKNTLQVKIAVKGPPPDLKPDMLVRLTFLAVLNSTAIPETQEPLRLLVPRQLVETGEGGPRVWLADQAAGRARSRPVKLGQASGTELIEVLDGLAATDKVISGGREGLHDGERITVSGEDTSQGVTTAGGGPGKRVTRLPSGAAGPQGK